MRLKVSVHTTQAQYATPNFAGGCASRWDWPPRGGQLWAVQGWSLCAVPSDCNPQKTGGILLHLWAEIKHVYTSNWASLPAILLAGMEWDGMVGNNTWSMSRDILLMISVGSLWRLMEVWWHNKCTSSLMMRGTELEGHTIASTQICNASQVFHVMLFASLLQLINTSSSHCTKYTQRLSSLSWPCCSASPPLLSHSSTATRQSPPGGRVPQWCTSLVSALVSLASSHVSWSLNDVYNGIFPNCQITVNLYPSIISFQMSGYRMIYWEIIVQMKWLIAQSRWEWSFIHYLLPTHSFP